MLNDKNQQELFVETVLRNWNLQNERLGSLLDELSDEALAREVAPGRNTGNWILGHLIAVSDSLLPLLGLGEKLHPELKEVFIDNSDKSGIEFPATADLRKFRKEVDEALAAQFSKLQPAEWLMKHSVVAEEEFAKAPYRNRLGMVINRMAHIAYHLGQLIFLKK